VSPGGGENFGRLRRQGNGVVRPAGDHSPGVQSFLRHLEEQGFDGAPRVLEVSPSEEVLSFTDATSLDLRSRQRAAGVWCLRPALRLSASSCDGSTPQPRRLRHQQTLAGRAGTPPAAIGQRCATTTPWSAILSFAVTRL
jgi:hypothetical protein